MVSDYLQYFEEYDVPRTRYDSKVNKRLLGNIQRDKTNETSNNSYHRLKQEKKIQTKQQQL